jgi:hypothetical protein
MQYSQQQVILGKIIGDEAWIAMYNRGFEAWTFNRRLDNRTYTPTPPVKFYTQSKNTQSTVQM